MINQIQSKKTPAHLKEVVEDLLFASEKAPLTPLMEKVLDERIARHHSGKGKTYSQEEVLERLRGSFSETPPSP